MMSHVHEVVFGLLKRSRGGFSWIPAKHTQFYPLSLTNAQVVARCLQPGLRPLSSQRNLIGPSPSATGNGLLLNPRFFKHNSWKRFFSLFGLVSVTGLSVWLSLGVDVKDYRNTLGDLAAPQTVKCLESGSRSKQYNFIAEAVDAAIPAVVFIKKMQPVATVFGEQMAVSSGSGFIVDENGYVLTNAHVVGRSQTVGVKLHSGEEVQGTVTHIDEVADLALIKLSKFGSKKLPCLRFGSSSELRPGEWVVALGSPLSLTNTITAGIVSSANRPSKDLGLQRDKPDMAYVQTDAPITIGNSGGPLVNLDGEVIGVNTMTAGPGISFAVPSDFAKEFVSIAKGTKKTTAAAAVSSGGKFAIGVSMLSVTPELLHMLQQRGNAPPGLGHGVLLANVWSNSPAAQAGLKNGDIIVRINGKNIHYSNEVYKVVQTGKRLNMEIVRQSQWMTVTVQPESL